MKKITFAVVLVLVILVNVFKTLGNQAENEIIQLLDLPDEPRKGSSDNDSIPSFLLSAYKLWTDDDARLKRDTDSVLSDEDKKYIVNSDRIIVSKARNITSVHIPRTGKVMSFKLNDNLIAKDIFRVELRLYKKKTDQKLDTRVTVYGVNDLSFHYYDSINVESSFEGWIHFDVTNYFKSKQNRSHTLLVRPYYTEDFIRTIESDDEGIIFTENNDFSPFVTIFLKTDEFEYKKNIPKKVSTRALPEPSQCCHLRPQYVDFRLMNISDLIIAPNGYDANFCSGICDSSGCENLVNYSVMQNLYRKYNNMSTEVLEASCVPTEMSGLTVLHFNGETNIVMRTLSYMKATECRCR